MLTQAAAKQVLIKITDILKSLGLTYWIDSGTLLSAYRDKNINLFDHDLDIRTFIDEFNDDLIGEYFKLAWKSGFNWFEAYQLPFSQILTCHENKTVVDLKLCYRDKEHIWYYCWNDPNPMPILHVYPVRFFETFGSIELLGNGYPCPQPIEEYLNYHYGPDWRQFKARAEQADESDFTWDYMKSPPCAMTLQEFWVLKGDYPYVLFG